MHAHTPAPKAAVTDPPKKLSKHERIALLAAMHGTHRRGGIARVFAHMASLLDTFHPDSVLEAIETCSIDYELSLAVLTAINTLKCSNLDAIARAWPVDTPMKLIPVTVQSASSAGVVLAHDVGGLARAMRVGDDHSERLDYVSGILSEPDAPHLTVAFEQTAFCQIPVDEVHRDAIARMASGAPISIPSMNVLATVQSRGIKSKLRTRLARKFGEVRP